MRVRSEWLTLFTVTAFAAGALFLHRGGSSDPAPAKRSNVAAGSIDFTPVGTIHPLTNAHPTPKPVAPHGKTAPTRP